MERMERPWRLPGPSWDAMPWESSRRRARGDVDFVGQSSDRPPLLAFRRPESQSPKQIRFLSSIYILTEKYVFECGLRLAFAAFLAWLFQLPYPDGCGVGVEQMGERTGAEHSREDAHIPSGSTMESDVFKNAVNAMRAAAAGAATPWLGNAVAYALAGQPRRIPYHT